MIVLNLKNYQESFGTQGQMLVDAAARFVDNYPYLAKLVVVSPPVIHLEKYRTTYPQLTFATQHVDVSVSYGSTTGWLIPETLHTLGITITLINHSEHRVDYAKLVTYITRLNSLNIRAVVCVENIQEARLVLSAKPFAIAYEPKELIGSGISVTTRPQELQSFVSVCSGDTLPLAGAGVTTTKDVQNLLRLGAKGALLASGFVKAKDPYQKLLELCEPYILKT